MCAYHIVGLKSGHLYHGDVISLDDALDVGHSELNILGSLVAVGLIFLVSLMAEGSARRVETHSQVGGTLLLEHILQGVDKSEDCRRVEPSCRESRVAHQGIIGTENERISVEKKKLHDFAKK